MLFETWVAVCMHFYVVSASPGAAFVAICVVSASLGVDFVAIYVTTAIFASLGGRLEVRFCRYLRYYSHFC